MTPETETADRMTGANRSALDVFLDESVDHFSSEPAKRLSIDVPEVHSKLEMKTNVKEEPPLNQKKSRRTSNTGEKNPSTGTAGEVVKDREDKQEAAAKDRGGKKKNKRNKGKDEEDLKLMSQLLQSAGTKKTRQQRHLISPNPFITLEGFLIGARKESKRKRKSVWHTKVLKTQEWKKKKSRKPSQKPQVHWMVASPMTRVCGRNSLCSGDL